MNSAFFASSKGWRLPTMMELQTLLIADGSSLVLPAFSAVEPTTYAGVYWSSTESASNLDHAWDVNFSTNGDVGVNGKSGGAHRVRAVRGGF